MIQIRKSVILGLIIAAVSIVVGKILSKWMLTIEISGVIGLICLCIAGLLNGSFISGDMNRANYSFDTEEDRNKKSRITNFLFAVGLPNIILTIIVLLLNKS